MKKYLIFVLLLVVAFPGVMKAQRAGLKTNALYWATATPNLGVEFRLADRITFNIEGGYNPFTLDDSKEVNKKIKHFLVSPEIRYWFCESFNGHFIGVNGNYSQFNVSAVDMPEIFYAINDPQGWVGMDKNSRNEGWAAGAGITYGYQWILGKRLNMEATIGAGYWYTSYEQFDNRKCGLFQRSLNRHMLGLTKCGLSFIYLIK